jgi:hypothetical protein
MYLAKIYLDSKYSFTILVLSVLFHALFINITFKYKNKLRVYTLNSRKLFKNLYNGPIVVLVGQVVKAPQ